MRSQNRPVQEADELDLLPTPRELELRETYWSLEGWEIVVPVGVDLAEVAAEELNTRIREVGGTPLPVVNRPTGRPALFVGRWLDPDIRSLSMALNVTLTPTDPGEQGYIIEFGSYQGRRVALLGGSDAQGALYAGVTFRRLIREPEHEVGEKSVARLASIRDWPDFDIRNTARIDFSTLRHTGATLENLDPLYDAAESLKRSIDFWLRHKVNCLFAEFFFPDDSTDPELAEHQQAQAREVISYARDRGIRIRYVGGVEVGTYLTEAEQSAAVERWPGTCYEWAAFEAHRTQASRYAGFLEDAGGDVFSLHLNDQGGYIDPEKWSKRSPWSQDMYEDRTMACIEQFETYFQAVRDAAPGVELESIPYPYHFQFARTDFPDTYEALRSSPALSGLVAPIRDSDHAREIRSKLMAHHRRLAEALSNETAIVVREADRATVEAAADLYEDHPMMFWIYPDRNRGWKGTFAPQVRMAETFLLPKRQNGYFLASIFPESGDDRVHRLAQQEYLWKADRPDASARFSQWQRSYEAGGEVTPFQRNHLIPRIARILYGNRGETVADLLAANASFRYVADPVTVACGQHDTEDFENIYEYMAEQAEIFEAAHEEVATVFNEDTTIGNESTVADRCDETQVSETSEGRRLGKTDGTGELAAWIAFYYRYTGLAKLKAELEAAAEECRKQILDGRPEAVSTRAEAVDEDLVAMQKERDRIVEATDGRLPDRIQPLDEFEPTAFASTFEELSTLAQDIAAAGGVSEYVADRLDDRDATAAVELLERADQTVTYGYTTILGLMIELVSQESLADRQVVIDVADGTGESIVEITHPAEQFRGSWIQGRPVKMDLGDAYDGDLRVDVSFASAAAPLASFVVTEDGELRMVDAPGE